MPFKNTATRIIPATLNWMNETEFSEMMSATYKMFQEFMPNDSKEDIWERTLYVLKPENNIVEKQQNFKESFSYLFSKLKDGWRIIFQETTGFVVEDNQLIPVFPDEILDNIKVKIQPDVRKYIHPSIKKDSKEFIDAYKKWDKDIQLYEAPVLIQKFFEVLAWFPFDSVVQCVECGNYFFEPRKYERRFCSKRCNDRYSVRKSRAKKAAARIRKGSKK
jgi:hypothetical protein